MTPIRGGQKEKKPDNPLPHLKAEQYKIPPIHTHTHSFLLPFSHVVLGEARKIFLSFQIETFSRRKSLTSPIGGVIISKKTKQQNKTKNRTMQLLSHLHYRPSSFILSAHIHLSVPSGISHHLSRGAIGRMWRAFPRTGRKCLKVLSFPVSAGDSGKTSLPC